MTMVETRNKTIGPITGRILSEPLSDRPFAELEAASMAAVKKRSGPAWHIVHCLGQDQHALDFLKTLKFETYYPAVREMRAVPRKKLSQRQRASGIPIMRPRIVPIFPRYIFTRFDMGRDGWREIFQFAGVGGMVCEGQLPVWVPDSMINNIRCREIDGAVPGKISIVKLLFAVGDQVRVTDGPLAMFLGTVEREYEEAIEDVDPDDRIRIAVSVFGRVTPVDLALSQIEKQ